MSMKRRGDRCRLCLLYKTSCVDVVKEDKLKISVMIFQMFDFMIIPSDVFPTKVCRQCVKDIQNVNSFIQKVKKAQICLQDELINPDKVDADDLEKIITEDSTEINNIFIDVKEEPFNPSNLTDKEIIQSENLSEIGFDSEDDAKLISIIQKTTTETNTLGSQNENKKFNKDCKSNIDDKSLDVKYSNENISETIFNFIDRDGPIELFRNGKSLVKGKEKDILMAQFYKFKCTICVNSPHFELFDTLSKHYINDHNTKGFVACHCCNKKLVNRKAAFEHMRKHIQPTAFQCPICEKNVSRSYLLVEHLQRHLPDSEKPRKCDQCDKRFTASSAFRKHMLSHTVKENIDIVKCDQCSKQFTNKINFKRHLESVHTSPKYLCSVCGKKFKTSANYNYHLTTHDDRTKICCKECGFVAKNKITLKKHQERHFNEVLHCDKCEYTTLMKKTLVNHMKIKHSDEKPFQCSICKKRFKMKSTLEVHFLQHTGEKKYLCKYCPKTFASSGNQSLHMRRMHAVQIQEEARRKKLLYDSVLEAQLIQEREEIKSQELARQHIKDLESSFKHTTKLINRR